MKTNMAGTGGAGKASVPVQVIFAINFDYQLSWYNLCKY